MTCGSCTQSVRGADYQVIVENRTDDRGEYALQFGSRLRQGRIHQVSDGARSVLVSGGGGKEGVTGRDLGAREKDQWVADGPITFQNTGSTPLLVQRNGTTSVVRPGDTINTSCPTERRRKLGLGVAAGSIAGGVLSKLFS